MLKEDILFACQPPIPSQATSSSRSLTFSLSKADAKKARHMFLTKAYYPTTTTYAILDRLSVYSVFIYVPLCLMCAWCVGKEFVFVCVLDVCLCLMGVCESAFECTGTVPILVPVAVTNKRKSWSVWWDNF
jgi:hypothetical protein